jgi:hypothetical protein
MCVGRLSARRARKGGNEGKQGEGEKEIAGGDTGAPSKQKAGLETGAPSKQKAGLETGAPGEQKAGLETGAPSHKVAGGTLAVRSIADLGTGRGAFGIIAFAAKNPV